MATPGTLASADSLTIAGIPRFFLPGSLRITESANGRNTLSLDIPSVDGTYRPQIGDEVVVSEGATIVFGGVIEQPGEAGIGGEGRFPIVTKLSVPDFSTYADRRYVSGLIPAGTLRSQLQALVPYLADHGVTMDPGQVDGPGMTEIPCDFIQLSQLLDQMATITGYVWEVDYTKHLKMFSPGITPAPFNITSGDGHCIGDVTVDRSRQDYANRIILRFTNAAIASWGFLSPISGLNFVEGDEVVLGSSTYTFSATLDDKSKHGTVLIGQDWFASANYLINVIVNGGDGFSSATGTPANSQADTWITQYTQIKAVAKTPGAAGNNVATTTTSVNSRWYWEGGQDASALMGGADEALTAQVESNDRSQQQTYGMWEKIVSAASVRDWNIAQQLCDSLLQQALTTISIVKYETSATGLHPGMTQTITIPERGLSGVFTITDVEIALLETNPRRTVTLTGGSIVVKRWQDDAKTMLGGGGGGTSVGSFSVTGGSGGGGGGGGKGNTDLDYKGDYVATVYNDGDIVIGPDGVAYMCTKDGVATPPEPWPGTGIVSTVGPPGPPGPPGPQGPIGGSGTVGHISKWITSITLTDSIMTETASLVTVAGTLAATTLQGQLDTSWLTGVVSLGHGGTNAALVAAAGAVVYSTDSALGLSIVGGPNQLLRSNGTLAPNWTTGLTFDGTTLVLTGDETVSGSIGSPIYGSQTTGWRIDATGGADFRYLFTDELHAKSFVTDLEQALVGGQIIAKSVAMVAVAFTAPAAGVATTLRVRDIPSAPDIPAFQTGDTVVLRGFARSSGTLTIADCVGVVSAYVDQIDGTQTWTFTRNSAAGTTGTMVAGIIIQPDALVLDYGVSGNGYYEVNAADGANAVNSPYAQIVTWTVAPTGSNRMVRTRVGNLYGITSVSGEYGLIAGVYAASGGQFLRSSNLAFELHGIDLLLWDGAVNTVKINHTVPSLAFGNPLPTSYGVGTGIWMGKDAGIYKFRVGSGSSFISWDGSTLVVTGSVNVVGGNAAKTDLSNVTGGYAGSSSPGGSANNTLNVGSLPASGVAATNLSNVTGNYAAGNAPGGSAINTLAVGSLPSSTIQGWSHPSNATLIDGGDIYTGTITAYQIAVRSLTADRIATGTLTANEIAARSISGDRIAAGQITAYEVAARSLSADRIAAGQITAYEIAANTITATNIVAGSITADKLNVTTLSAITANLGTVNAGTINGVNINGSSISGGAVYVGGMTLDNNGITVSAGSSAANSVKWSDGTWIHSYNNFLVLDSGGVQLLSGGQACTWQGGALTGGGNPDLGNNSTRWRDIWLTGQFMWYGSTFYLPNLPTTSAGGNYMWIDGNGYMGKIASSLRYKDDPRPWTMSVEKFLTLQPITFQYKGSTERLLGFAAEDLYDIDPFLAGVDKQKRPEMIRFDALFAYLFQVVKLQDARITQLESEQHHG